MPKHPIFGKQNKEMKNYIKKYAQLLKEFTLIKTEKEYLSIENNDQY
jgi:hypothetical protein